VGGGDICPYYSRSEMYRGALKVLVIAWVDSDWDLYIMQIQGSGKIRLPSGELLRVGYAEQNGHPFLPPVRSGTRGDALEDIPLIRGIPIQLPDSDPATQHRGSVSGHS